MCKIVAQLLDRSDRPQTITKGALYGAVYRLANNELKSKSATDSFNGAIVPISATAFIDFECSDWKRRN
jgi:hypothetical protein